MHTPRSREMLGIHQSVQHDPSIRRQSVWEDGDGNQQVGRRAFISRYPDLIRDVGLKSLVALLLRCLLMTAPECSPSTSILFRLFIY